MQQWRRPDTTSVALGWRPALAFAGTCAWLLLARWGRIPETAVMIVAMWLVLLPVHARLSGVHCANGASWWTARLPFALFEGWLSLAIFANTAAALKRTGVPTSLGGERWMTVAFLLCAAAIAVPLATRPRVNVPYAATVSWGLIGVAVANLTRQREPLIASVAALLTCALLLATWWSARRSSATRHGPDAIDRQRVRARRSRE